MSLNRHFYPEKRKKLYHFIYLNWLHIYEASFVSPNSINSWNAVYFLSGESFIPTVVRGEE